MDGHFDFNLQRLDVREQLEISAAHFRQMREQQMTENSETKTKSSFDHPFFHNKPALAALKDSPQPEPEHIRACLMEMARHIIKNDASAIGTNRQ